MKDICQAVYEKLCSDSSISRYVCGRIYPIVLPEDAPLPAIVYTPVLANYDSALQGDTGFVRQTMQFVCHDATYKKARELSRKVKCVFLPRLFQQFFKPWHLSLPCKSFCVPCKAQQVLKLDLLGIPFLLGYEREFIRRIIADL